MSNKIPQGYTQWVSAAGRVILLPHRTARALEKARDEPGSDGKTAGVEPSTPQSRLKERKDKKARGGRGRRSRSSDQAGPVYRQVLHNFDSISDQLWREQTAKRCADQDEQKRVRVMLDKLHLKGPDRRVGLPRDWRASLAALEQVLPHFRGPLGVVGNALALSEASVTAVRIPPLLLLGPPGVGKTLFTHRLAAALGVPTASIAFDQANAGTQLYGSDKHWSNTQSGLLFQLLCEGEYANPVVLLDELDKASLGNSGARGLDLLAQLHGALEVQTAKRAKDLSTDIEFDASLVTYVATANSLRGMGMPLLSRFEVFVIDPPTKSEAVGIARHIAEQAGSRLGLAEPVAFERKCFYVLAHMSPRLMVRTVDKAVAEAVAQRRRTVSEQDVWRLSGLDDATSWTH